MRVLVTGCAGFIGSTLTEALLARGDEVVGLDNLVPTYDLALKRANLTGPLGSEGFRLVEGDIRDGALVAETMAQSRPEAIVHLAALAGVRPSLENPGEYTSVNVGGTVTLLEAARQAGVGQFVFGSSSSVYGATNQVPFSETQSISHPVSPYAASKAAGEAYCYTYHHLYGIHATLLRFFTVFGPRQRPDLAINKFVRLMLAGQPIPMFGDGTSSRDYTYVGDIVRGILAALDRSLELEIINLGGSSPVTLRELIATIGEVMGHTPVIEQCPNQPGDVPRTYADVTKALRVLDWEPQVSLREGLERFVQWYTRGQACNAAAEGNAEASGRSGASR